MKKVRLLVMDVDGTLTDGRIYMGARGEVMKAFDIKDGYAIHEILPRYGIVPAILTGRRSEIVANRAAELGIEEVHQGKHDKLDTLVQVAEKYGCAFEEIAYIGDDILDLDGMRRCGVKGCPADAAGEVKAEADFVSSRCGGQGAVREFIQWLTKGYGGGL